MLFRKKLTRSQFARFMASLPRCIVAVEACGTPTTGADRCSAWHTRSG